MHGEGYGIFGVADGCAVASSVGSGTIDMISGVGNCVPGMFFGIHGVAYRMVVGGFH